MVDKSLEGNHDFLDIFVTRQDDVLSRQGKIEELQDRIENSLAQILVCVDDKQKILLEARTKELSQQYFQLTGKHYVTSSKRHSTAKY